MNYYERLNAFVNSAAFGGLTETTQILVPEFRGARKPKNRQSHSYEVALCAKAMLSSMAIPGLDLDRNNAIELTCLAHDLGHPPFGHDGQKLLNKIIKEKGLKEGFDDNAQTIEVLKKHRLLLSNHELASIVKYPNKLYSYQKKEMNRILTQEINADYIHFKNYIKMDNNRTRTFICDVMDLADEIAYTTSDNEDFYILRYGDEEFFVNELDSGRYKDDDILSFLLLVINAIQKDDKVLIKSAFNKLRFMMCDNYYIGDNLKILSKRDDLAYLKDKMYQFEVKNFIHSKKIDAARDVYKEIFKQYIDWVFEGNYPSRTYKKLIKTAENKEIKLRMIRDMIAETTDLYVLDWFKKQEKD